MKRVSLASAALLAALAISAPALAATEISGAWKITFEHGTGTPVCTITQKGKTLSGRCINKAFEWPLSGSLDGKNVKWMWRENMGRTTIIWEFVGQWDLKDTITGMQTGRIDEKTPLPPGSPLKIPEPQSTTATRQTEK